jgi:septal ring factor EnvC (AmiA/AmiB activator)
LLPPRPAVAPNLARLLMDRLVQALLSQRRDLMAGQADAAEQIAAIEQRLALVQSKLQRRLAYYEEEMAGLREELAAKETENRALRQQLQSRPPLPFGAPPRVKRATLNAELLLRS